MAAGVYNPAATHLQDRRDLLVNPKAPAHRKVAANPLLPRKHDQIRK